MCYRVNFPIPKAITRTHLILAEKKAEGISSLYFGLSLSSKSSINAKGKKRFTQKQFKGEAYQLWAEVRM